MLRDEKLTFRHMKHLSGQSTFLPSNPLIYSTTVSPVDAYRNEKQKGHGGFGVVYIRSVDLSTNT